MVSSPNFPRNYPHNLDKTESIKVKVGKTLRMEFTYFAVTAANQCPNDYVKITDGDGTTLMDRSCGYSTSSSSSWTYFQPPIIMTRTDTVNIFFHTDDSGTHNGWSMNWTVVTPGFDTIDQGKAF